MLQAAMAVESSYDSALTSTYAVNCSGLDQVSGYVENAVCCHLSYSCEDKEDICWPDVAGGVHLAYLRRLPGL